MSDIDTDGPPAVETWPAAHTLLEDIVATPSVSGEEAACAERLAAFFEAHDRPVGIDAVGNVRAPGTDVLLTSHIDTVPGEWPVEVTDGVLHGRGAVDAKGPLCALAAAAVRTGASFAGVVGEETDSRGARHLIEDAEVPAAVINGEPGGWDAVTLGYRGYLAGTYSVATTVRHSSRPEPNAIQHAIAWWDRVEAAFDREGSVPTFERVTPKPTGITGGVEDGRSMIATVEAGFRYPPSEDAQTVRSTVEAALAAGEIRWDESIPPTMRSPRNPVASAFRAAIRALGGAPSHRRKTGTSDMNLYADAWECPMVTYGPGDSSLDHTPEERLALAEYDRSIAVIERAVERLHA